MYEPDGNETIVHFRRTKESGEPPENATLSVDSEDYARMIHEGWEVVEDVQTFVRDTIDPEDFKAAQSMGRSDASVHIRSHS